MYTESLQHFPARDEVLQWLGEYVKLHWQAEATPVSGSHASNLIIDRFGRIDFRAYGAEKFKDFLSYGEGKYFKTVIQGTNHAIFPVDDILPPISLKLTERKILRRDVWTAFTNREQPHYFNRRTKTFFLGISSDPSDLRVEAIDDTTQAGWLNAFIEKQYPVAIPITHKIANNHIDGQTVAISGSFLPPQIRSAWKQFRFGKIAEAAQQWCRDNSVEIDIFASIPFHKASQTRVASGPVVKRASNLSAKNRDKFRQALLAALESMPTEELSRLPIPPCYIWPNL